MAYRSIDEEYVERLREMGLTSDAFVLHTELVCRGKMSGILSLAFASLRSRLKLDTKSWNQAVSCLLKKERIEVDEEHEIIWLIGFVEHQWLAKGKLSDTIKQGILNEYNALPKTFIREAFQEKYPTLFDTPSDTLSDTPNDTSEKKSPLKGKWLKGKVEMGKGGVRPKAAHHTPTEFEQAVEQIHSRWKDKFGTAMNFIGRDGKFLKTLLSRFGLGETVRRWEFYLDNPDRYCQENGQSFANFFSAVDKVGSRMVGVQARDTRFDNLKQVV